MKLLVALAVIFLISTQLFAEEIGANDDLNYWSDWSDSDQIKVRDPNGLGSCCLPLVVSPALAAQGNLGLHPWVPHKA